MPLQGKCIGRSIMQDFTHCNTAHNQSIEPNTYIRTYICMSISSFRHATLVIIWQSCHLGDYLIFVCMDIIYYVLCNMHSCFRSSYNLLCNMHSRFQSSKLHVFGRNKSLAYTLGLCLDKMRAITQYASFSRKRLKSVKQNSSTG